MLEAQQRAMMHVAERVAVHAARAAHGERRDDRARAGQRRARASRLGDHVAARASARRQRRAARRSCSRSSAAASARSSDALADFDHSGDPPRLLLGSRERPRDRRRATARWSPTPSSARAIDTLDRGVRPPHARRCSRRCRARAIHGDLNDYNVLVGGDGDVESRDQRVTGIVDFGDMVHSYRVGDLAIAIAYVDARRRRSARRRGADGARLLRAHARSTRRRAGGAVRARRAASVHERVHRRRPAARSAPTTSTSA